MKYKLNTFCNISYHQIDSDVSKMKRSEHSYVREKIFKELSKRVNTLNDVDEKNNRDIKNQLKDLYNFRVDSDYKNIQIGQVEADSAFRKAKAINYHINKIIK